MTTSPPAPGAGWMTRDFARLGPRALRELALPATHDAGMSALTASTLGSTACNTVTQVGDVGAQLDRGSRYFDLRPVSLGGTAPFALGHFSKVPLVDGKVAGGTGQPLAEALGQVAAFLAQPGSEREVVILKFSHFLALGGKPSGLLPAASGGAFSAADFAGLVAAVRRGLGSSLYAAPAGGPSLNDATLAALAAGPGRAVAVFDLAGGGTGGFPSGLVDPTVGVFSYNDLGKGAADLVVADSYADTDHLAAMVADQGAKFRAFRPAPGASFLLSWTLTQKDPLSGSTCILKLAAEANAALAGQLATWTRDGTVAAGRIPNLVYVDGLEDDAPALAACDLLNGLTN